VIVVAGEALIDLTPTARAGGSAYVPHPGGSSYNVAVGLGRLGTPTAFLGRLSRDPFGRMLREHLESCGVSTELTVTGSEPTAVAFVHLGADEPEYSFHIAHTADRSLLPTELPRLPDGADCIHFGSISLVMEPAASTYEYLGRREAGRRLLTLNPNIRPSLVPDPDVYRCRLEDWVARVDLVKVSAADLAWFAPDVSVGEVAARWLDLGAALILVTLGSEGAEAYVQGGSVRADPAEVMVVDTVGAGDAFTAAVLASLHRDGCLDRRALEQLSASRLGTLLSFATMAASRSCARPGADPLWASELAARDDATRRPD
jgi:fructokinase